MLEQVDGVLVPGGFGSRGWEGKILACRVARERGIPYLGICLGMHVAVSEFARHVVGLEGANSTEMDPETPYPVIDLLPEQKEIEDLGGTMRLGAQAVEVAEGTRTREIYDEAVIHERHRHRFEVNNHLRPQLVEHGLVVSGTFQEGRLVEIIELPGHPWFVASQFHPEFKSRPTRPGAAVPRVRRRRARAQPLARGRVAARACVEFRRVLAGPADALPGARCAAEPARAGARRRRPRARLPAGARARGRRRTARGRWSAPRSGISTAGWRGRHRGDRCSSAPTSTPCRRAGRSSRWSRTAGSETRAGRSSAATTRRRWSRCSRRCGGCSEEGRPHAGIELVFTPKEEVGPARGGGVRRNQARGAGRLRLRPAGADRRDRPGRADPAVAGRASSTGARRTRGWCPRRVAPRSRPRRGRSPTSGSGGSTRRPRPTSA